MRALSIRRPAPGMPTPGGDPAWGLKDHRRDALCHLSRSRPDPPPPPIIGELFYSTCSSCSWVSSQSRRIWLSNPGPIVSPAWTGTVVTRPSECRRR